METVRIIQSSAENDAPCWLQPCLQSVREWADAKAYDYRFMGNELLDMVPDWYAEKLRGRTPIITDLARLNWMQREFASAGAPDVIAWLDADTLVFAPALADVSVPGDCIFGREHWLQHESSGRPGKLRAYRSIHNAYCAFRRNSPTLPFLIETVQRLIAQVDPARIAPQFVGPKLLSALHNIVKLDFDDRFGAISPTHARLLLEGASAKSLPGNRSGPLCAANLSQSLQGEIDRLPLIEYLLKMRDGL